MEATRAGFFGATGASSASVVKSNICDGSITRRRRRRRSSKKTSTTTTTTTGTPNSSLRRSRLAPARACLGNGGGDSLDGKGREGEKNFDLSLAAERLEAALAAATENERSRDWEDQQPQQSRHLRNTSHDGGIVDTLESTHDGTEIQIPLGLRWSDGPAGNSIATTLDHRERYVHEEVEESEVLLRGLEAQLEVAIKREDYNEASRLSAAVNALKRKDTVKTVVSQLESALLEERYEEAAVLRDDGAAGLLGWWVAYKSIDGQRLPHGYIIKVEPRFARYVAKSYTARDLYEGKDGKDVLEAYLTDKGNGQYHKDVFLLREKVKPSSLLDSSAEGNGITISGMTGDDGLDDDDLAQVEIENVDFVQHDEHNFELKIQVTSYDDESEDDEQDEEEDNVNDTSNDAASDWAASVTKRVLELKGLRSQGKQTPASNAASSSAAAAAEAEDDTEEDSDEKDKDDDTEMGLLGVKRRDGEDDVSHQSRKQERARQIAQLLATGSLKFPGGSNDLSQLQFDASAVITPEVEEEKDRQRVQAYLYQRGKHTFAFETSGECSVFGQGAVKDSRESGNPGLDNDDYSLTLVSAASKAIDFAEEARGAESPKAKTDAIAKAVHLLRQAAQKQSPHGFPSSAIFRRLHVNTNLGLEGVFAGSFGLHGPECVQLIRAPASSVYSDVDDDEEGDMMEDKDEVCISALKLTGDPNVPAGEMTFRAKIGQGRRLDHRGEYPEELGVKARYKGQGRVAQLGFKQPQWVDGELLVFDQCRSAVTGGAELGFVWCIPGERRFLVLFNRLNLDKI